MVDGLGASFLVYYRCIQWLLPDRSLSVRPLLACAPRCRQQDRQVGTGHCRSTSHFEYRTDVTVTSYRHAHIHHINTVWRHMPYKVNMADAISMGDLLIDHVMPFRQRRRSAGDDQAGRHSGAAYPCRSDGPNQDRFCFENP
jgi:hypothetical protein